MEIKHREQISIVLLTILRLHEPVCDDINSVMNAALVKPAFDAVLA